jgi:hypothetical protein
MKTLYILIFSTIILTVSCSENFKHDKQTVSQKKLPQKITNNKVPKEELAVNDSADNLQTLVPFKYKELDESYLDSLEKIDPSSFYGSWTITDISNVGGTFQKERTIRNQIGNKLLISKNKCSFNLLGRKSEIANPECHIETIEIEDGPETKGTTYFFGYRPERKQIKFVVIKDVGYFEIIHFAEIAIYYDGRIYFLQKD